MRCVCKSAGARACSPNRTIRFRPLSISLSRCAIYIHTPTRALSRECVCETRAASIVHVCAHVDEGQEDDDDDEATMIASS